MITFKQYIAEQNTNEEAAANSVAGAGVDMNITGKKHDKRSKWSLNHMFRRADGTKYKRIKQD